LTGKPTCVLDASALLAYLRNEPGADSVRQAIHRCAAISAVNWAEVLAKLADLGEDPDSAASRLFAEGLAGTAVLIWSFEEGLARESARLRSQTRALGLSLGDRACLALGRSSRLPILTADRSWRQIRIGVEIRAIR